MKIFQYILLFIALSGNAQNKANVTYSVLFNSVPYSKEAIKQHPDLYSRYLKKKERTPELTFTLYINNDKALFTHPPVNENDKDLFFAFQTTDGEFTFYTDFDKNQQIVQFPYWGAEIYIENKINEEPWQLTNESKKIGEYTCFKAIKKYVEDSGGRKNTYEIEAWYAPEIPIKFGPKQYVGLPGLIVELQESYITYYLKSIDFNPKEQPEIIPLKKGMSMTWEEFAEKSAGIKRAAKDAIINSDR